MSHPVFEVSVVTRRVQIVNRWVSEKWEIEAVEPSAARVETIRCETLPEDRFYWRGFRLDLHPSEAEGYYLNMREPEPRVFVMWRLEEWEGAMVARPWVTTASYHEAARMMDASETVDSVVMPHEILAWIEPWLIANYKPEPRRKKKRNQDFWGDNRGAAQGDQGVAQGNQGVAQIKPAAERDDRAVEQRRGPAGADA